MRKQWNRLLSAVLSVVMVLSCTANSVVALDFTSNKFGAAAGATAEEGALTLGEVLAENYNFLSEKEKAVIKCSALYGADLTTKLVYPDDADALIQINAEEKTVEVANYTDAEGNVWKPISAEVLYRNEDGVDATPISLPLDENGHGSFSCPATQYRVEVEYALYKTFDPATQLKYINLPRDFADGIVNMEALYRSRWDIGSITSNLEALRVLLDDGAFPVQIGKDTAEYQAIYALIQESEANNGTLNICPLLDAYPGGTRETGNRVKYMLEHGDHILAESNSLSTKLMTICGDDSLIYELLDQVSGYQLSEDQADKVEMVERALDFWRYEVAEVLLEVEEDNWNILSTDAVKSDVSEAEYQALYAAVKAELLIRNTSCRIVEGVVHHQSSELVPELLVAKKTLIKGVDQFKVVVSASAKVINKATTDSNALVTLAQPKTATLVLNKNTTAAEIEAAIAASGLKEAAIATFDPVYEVNEEHYSVSIHGVPEKLEGDVACEILFTPNEYTVTCNYDATANKTVYYGYRMLLPRHEDVTKSYDYTVNGALRRENTVVTITADTVVNRSEGEAVERYRVPAVIAGSINPGVMLTAEEQAVLWSTALSENYIWYRVPNQNTGLVKVTSAAGGSYTVTADSYASGLYSGASWAAVTGYAVDAEGNTVCEFDISDEVGHFITTESFESVRVHYELQITDVAGSEVLEWANLPNSLVENAAAHRSTMDYLYNRLFSTLGEVTGSKLDMINTISSKYSEEARQAIQEILSEGVDNTTGTRYLWLYVYLRDYHDQGLAYYYEGDRAEQIEYQLNLLLNNLEIVKSEPGFQQDLKDLEMESYGEKIDNVCAELRSVSFTPVSERINRYGTNLVELVSLIDKAKGHTSAHTMTDTTLTVGTDLYAAAPDRISVTVQLQVVSAAGEVVGVPASTVLTFPISSVDNAAVQAAVDAALARMEASMNVDTLHYTRTGDRLPEVLPEALTLVYTWSPNVYTVVIDGETGALGTQQFYADSSLAFTLPACAVPGTKYVYTIGSKTVEVGSADATYRIESLAAADALVGSDGKITVTRTEVDVNREELESLINDLNKAVVNAGVLDGQGSPMFAFIPYEDPNDPDKVTVVLRVSPASLPDSYKDLLMNVATAIADTAFSYIGIDNKALWNGQIHLQSIVDALANSGFSLAQLSTIIKEDGDLKEITEENAALATLIPIGAAADGTIHVGSAKIAHLELLGAKCLATTLQVGMNEQSAKNVDFYVTLEDFDRRPEQLKKVRKGLVTATKYLNVACEDEQFNVSVRVPETLYPYLLAAHSLVGLVDLEDVKDIDLGQAMEYDFNMVRDILTDKAFTVDTIERTLEMAGMTYDLEQFRSVVGAIRPVLNYLLSNASVQALFAAGPCTRTLTLDIHSLLKDRLGFSDVVLSFIAEAAEGEAIGAVASLAVTNMSTDYQALVIDYNAPGLRKLTFTTDLATAITGAGRNTIVVLLQDTVLSRPITVTNRTVLNLNGKKLTGDITSTLPGGTDSLFIVDSMIGTKDCGEVDGSVSGGVIITGGRYTACDVSGLLKKGYMQDAEGYVVNSLYTLEEDAAGNITVKLSPSFLNITTYPNVKALFVDIAVDLLVNFYTSAAVSIEDISIYDVEFDDLLNYLSMPLRSIANDVLDCFNRDGINELVKLLYNDLTDERTISNAIRNNLDVFTYEVETRNWAVNLSLEGPADSNYVRVDLTSGAEATPRLIKIRFSDAMTDEEREDLAALFEELFEVITLNDRKLEIYEISYDHSSLNVDFHGTVKVTMDLSENPCYAVAVAAGLAYNTSGTKRAALVQAIEEYLETETNSSLKAAIEAQTTAQLIAAIKSLRSMTFAELFEAIGVDCSEAVELAALYEDVMVSAAAVLSKLGLTGGASPLGAFEIANAEGSYEVSRTNWHRFDLALTVKLFDEVTYRLPEIGDPTVDLSDAALIAGALVDVEEKRIYLDLTPDGVSVNNISLIAFEILYADQVETKVSNLTGSVIRTESDLICNGDQLTVTATNQGGMAQVTYTIIVVGDTNCNGTIELDDIIAIQNEVLGEGELSDVALLAADVNHNDILEVGDYVANSRKYLGWDDGEYRSFYNENSEG